MLLTMIGNTEIRAIVMGMLSTKRLIEDARGISSDS